ncbi:PREDICTED: LOC109947995 [Prunus dulcis]|uniref:PREDICTED: LOC109947995 n=1 Tax=Prunus dulcis TaxID=3755 RepID=A0A5E4FN12_PRUDU|nr:PREDICTED: LOC109947995 [Prunus dulcis]
MTENYEHLRTKNAELEHDYRALKLVSHHSAPIQSRPDKGKGYLLPEATKSLLLYISPPRDRPQAPIKIYKDYRDCILELRLKPIPIPIHLNDPRVAHLGPLPKPTCLPTQEGARTRMIGNFITLRTGSLTIPKLLRSGKLIHLHLTNTTSPRHPVPSPMPTLPCDSSSRKSNILRTNNTAAINPFNEATPRPLHRACP